MERVTAELRDSLIAGFGREALHLEMRDLYAAADHGRFRTWLVGERLDPAAEEEWWRPWREMMRGHREAGRTLRRPALLWAPWSKPPSTPDRGAHSCSLMLTHAH